MLMTHNTSDRQTWCSKYRVEKGEAAVAVITLVCFAVSACLSFGRFLHAQTAIDGHVITGSVFYAAGLAVAAFLWSPVLERKTSLQYIVISALMFVLMCIGISTYSWFALGGAI